MPRDEEFLAPIGHAGVDYIRSRLRRRVMMELGITMRRRALRRVLTCLDKKATIDRIRELRDEAWWQTNEPVWALEMEPLLIEFHGPERYEGRPEVLGEDLMKTARHYTITHTMDALLKECGFGFVRSRQERQDDAAYYAVPRD